MRSFWTRLIKYETIFTQIKATFLLQERHYTTSAIKNFLFKKNGGKITSCLQKNIIQIALKKRLSEIIVFR